MIDEFNSTLESSLALIADVGGMCVRVYCFSLNKIAVPGSHRERRAHFVSAASTRNSGK
jgi:hypothetical protein